MQTELYGLMTSDPEAGKQRMVEIAAGQGVTLTTEEEDEFDCWMRCVRGGEEVATGAAMTTLNDFKQSSPC